MWTPQTIKVFVLTNIQVGFFNAIPPTVAVTAISMVVTFVDRKTGKSPGFSPFRMRRYRCPPANEFLRNCHAGVTIIHINTGIRASWTFSTTGQAECARFVADGSIAVDYLFTHRWGLPQADEAYRLFDRQTIGKAVFVRSEVWPRNWVGQLF